MHHDGDVVSSLQLIFTAFNPMLTCMKPQFPTHGLSKETTMMESSSACCLLPLSSPSSLSLHCYPPCPMPINCHPLLSSSPPPTPPPKSSSVPSWTRFSAFFTQASMGGLILLSLHYLFPLDTPPCLLFYNVVAIRSPTTPSASLLTLSPRTMSSQDKRPETNIYGWPVMGAWTPPLSG